MYTESRPAFDAKNRFNLPFVMPLDWKAFGAAVRAFYGLKGNGNGKRPASATVTESAHSVPMNGKPESEALVKVRQLMESAKISESEFIAVLQVARIPQALSASSLSNIPDKSFVLATENWASVIAVVDELRAQREAAQGDASTTHTCGRQRRAAGYPSASEYSRLVKCRASFLMTKKAKTLGQVAHERSAAADLGTKKHLANIDGPEILSAKEREDWNTCQGK